MTDLLTVMKAALHRFGRPRDEFRITDVDDFDNRLSTLERRQREIVARLQLLERESDPRRMFGLDRD